MYPLKKETVKKLLLATLIFLFSGSYASAQEVSKITGQIKDNQGISLPQVTIKIKGTNKGTVSDDDGKFTVNASINDILIFQSIGMTTLEVKITSNAPLQIQMKEDSLSLSEIEVVEIGYGQSLVKKRVTGAISEIKSNAINNRKQIRIDQALQGQTAGVQVSAQSGSPGAEAAIRIRGITSNGDNRPTFIVDGVKYDEGLDAIHPDQIEKITVLKDASASIYGVIAGNGVILITTKKGKFNQKPKYSFSSSYGISNVSSYLDVLDAKEYAIILNEMRVNSGMEPLFPDINAVGEGTNWQKEIFRQGTTENHSLNLTGGSESVKYSLGVNQMNVNGIIDRSDFKRFTSRLGLGIKLSEKLSSDISLLFTNIKKNSLVENGVGAPVYDALNFDPTISIANGNTFATSSRINQEVVNPLTRIYNTYDNANTDKMTAKVGFSYEVNKNIKVTARYGVNFAPIKKKIFKPLVHYGDSHNQSTLNAAGDIMNEAKSSVTEVSEKFWNWNLDLFASYKKEFAKKHEVEVLLGMSLTEEKGEHNEITGFTVPYNSFEFADVSATLGTTVPPPPTWQYKNRISSYFGRLNYAYKGKYLLNFILRRDGSNRFGSDKRFGYFPSVSAGWLATDESFMKNVSWLTLLKIRASYGISGNDKNSKNDDNSDYAYISLLRSLANYTFNNNIRTGQVPSRISNPDLGWEEIKQTNIGIDAVIFNNRFEFVIDYFIKKTEGLLVTPKISGIFGTGAPRVNAGSLENKGFEFSGTWNQVIKKNIDFSVTFNFSAIKNKVISVSNGVGFLSGGGYGIPSKDATRFETGKEAGYFFGYVTDGIFQNQTEINSHKIQSSAVPGDIRFKDENGDGKLDASDRTQIGSPFPDYTMGLSLVANIYDFDFSLNLFASIGNEIYIGYQRNLSGVNLPGYFIERWHGEGTSNSTPRVATNDNNQNSRASDRYIEDGSFLKIQNVQIGYNLPGKWLKKTSIDRARVYIASNNILTFTKYSGFDPEIGSNDIFNNGIDKGFYPQARTFTLGASIDF